MKPSSRRRNFIKTTSSATIGMSLLNTPFTWSQDPAMNETRIGIIGLDTSHCIAFAKLLNDPGADKELGGYRVIEAYPKGSSDIESSHKRIPGYTEKIIELGVQMVGSIEELIEKVDTVLETNDGPLHLVRTVICHLANPGGISLY